MAHLLMAVTLVCLLPSQEKSAAAAAVAGAEAVFRKEAAAAGTSAEATAGTKLFSHYVIKESFEKRLSFFYGRKVFAEARRCKFFYIHA
jgi:hypothetical protein